MQARLRALPEQLREQLAFQVSAGGKIRDMPADDDAERAGFLSAFRSWHGRNKLLLETSFTPVRWFEAGPRSQYVGLADLKFGLGAPLKVEQVDDLRTTIDDLLTNLDTLAASVDLYEQEDGDVALKTVAGDTQPGGATVFLVHGRDQRARLLVQDCLRRLLGFDVAVLAERPSSGLTLIEKLEQNVAEARHVVVLMTADDEGRAINEQDLQPRARQNVVLELGLAVGLVGRRNVTVLYEEGVELPSDYHGMVYVRFQIDGDWKLKLAGELKAAGLDVSMDGLV